MNKSERLSLMGEVVTVNRELLRIVVDRDVNYITTNRQPRAGWVVGFRTLQEGRRTSSGYDDCEEIRYLEITNTVSAVMVAYWPTRKPVPVPLDGFVEGGEPVYGAR